MMFETRHDFWCRQTLREKPHRILADWGKERDEAFRVIYEIACHGKTSSTEWAPANQARKFLTLHLSLSWDDVHNYFDK